MTQIAALDRDVVEVSGEDRVAFLQGLVSNDVTEAVPGRTVWAALLTPQGKYLADFFIVADAECLLLDCGPGEGAGIAGRLTRFRLRSRVSVRVLTDVQVYAAWGDPREAPAAIVAPDPRLPQAGWRLLSRAALPTTADFAAWDTHRLTLGLPDGRRDLEPEKTILLEAGFDELHGVSWGKGCYMGQELTARTKYRGLIKRRLVPVHAEGDVPAPGTPILAGVREAGTMQSGRGPLGLATLRLDALAETLSCGGVTLRASLPPWLRLPG